MRNLSVAARIVGAGLLALVAGPGPTLARAHTDAPIVRFEVRAGAVRLLRGEEERLVTGRDRVLELDCGARVEVPVRARMRFLLGDGGSFELVGPASVARADAEGTRLVFARLGELEYEGRTHGPELILPRGQVLRPKRSAFRLDGRAGGAVDFEHRAGQPVELDLGGRYPFDLAQGRRVRLPERLDAPGR